VHCLAYQPLSSRRGSCRKVTCRRRRPSPSVRKYTEETGNNITSVESHARVIYRSRLVTSPMSAHHCASYAEGSDTDGRSIAACARSYPGTDEIDASRSDQRRGREYVPIPLLVIHVI
jgi:hypothetical protein